MISDEYRKLNEDLHRNNTLYGAKSGRHLDRVLRLAELTQGRTFLDYGCGKGQLVSVLNERGLSAAGYDPAIPERAAVPAPADVVVCTDVLEHIEPTHLDAVLGDLRRVTQKGLLLLIALRPDVSKLLPDGTNPHKIVETWNWWEGRLRHFFPVNEWQIETWSYVEDHHVIAVLTKSARQ